MRVLLANAPWAWVRALAGAPDLELGVLVPSAWLPRMAGEGLADRAFAYDSRAKLDFSAIRQVRAAVKAFQPALLHAFYGRALANSLLATMWMPTPPAIVSFRGTTNRLSRLDPGDFISFLHPRVAGHACESDAVRQALLASGLASEKCWTTYSCVDLQDRARPGRAALRPYDVPADAFVVGTVATIRPVKGIDILLRAALECADLKDIYWVLIGPVHDRSVAKLAQDVRIRDRVRLLGLRHDALELISGADLFAMPSRMEGLSRALLEAMHQRVCPVVSDAGGLKEVVRDRQDGLVVPREDVPALAQAIRALYADRVQVRALAASAHQRVTEFFSPAAVIQRVTTLYRNVLAAGGG